jgi:hypothetical protein
LTIQTDGLFVLCDGDGCKAAVITSDWNRPGPLASASRSPKSWLVVVRDSGTYHFCPFCAPRMLDSVYGTQLPGQHLGQTPAGFHPKLVHGREGSLHNSKPIEGLAIGIRRDSAHSST